MAAEQAKTEQKAVEPKKEKRTPKTQGEYFYSQRALHQVLLFTSILLIGSCALMVYKDHDRQWKEFQGAYHKIEKIRGERELIQANKELSENEEKLKQTEADIKTEKKSLKKSEVNITFLWVLFRFKKALEVDGISTDKLLNVTNLQELDALIGTLPSDIRSKYQEISIADLITETRAATSFALNKIREGDFPGEIKKETTNLFERFTNVLDKLNKTIPYDKSAGLLDQLEAIFQVAKQNMEFSQADYTFLRWKFEEAKHHFELAEKDPEINKGEAEIRLKEAREEFSNNQLQLEARKITKEPIENFRRSAKFSMKMHERNLEYLKSVKTGLLKDKESIAQRMKDLKDTLANKVRNAPMLDFFGSTLEVKQVILEKIYDEYHFAQPQKVDRCQTCHVAIDNPNYATFRDKDGGLKFKEKKVQESFEQAFPNKADRDKYVKTLMAHPNLDTYVSTWSHHPTKDFGCTVCHDGDGRETEFSLAVHMPKDERQEKEWEKLYDYYHRHLWEQPMLPAGYYESSCRRCHDQERVLDEANKYNKGMQLFERAGCYACHKTDSYPLLTKHLQGVDGEVDESLLSKRPGPPLTNINSKVSKEWAYNWILSPRSFRPAAKMPHFFLQPNSRGMTIDNGLTFDGYTLDKIKAAALVEYIYNLNEEKDEYYPPIPVKGDAIRGEQIVNSVGCYACHNFTEEYDENYFREGTPLLDEFAPNLSGAGDKFSDEREKRWLYNWLKDPKHYFPDSKMPNLRLTNQEAADVMAFITSDNNTINNKDRKIRDLAGWHPEEPPVSIEEGATNYEKERYKELVEHILIEEFRRNMTLYDAKNKAKELTEAEKIRTLGQQLVKTYGCYSCHEIVDPNLPQSQQWTGLEGIGVELTGAQPWASKLLDRLDFGKAKYDGVYHHGLVFEHPLPLDEVFSGHNTANINQLDRFKKGDEYIIEIAEKREQWLKNKLLDPRVYDAGLLKSKPSDELTRMPNFNLTEKEADLISTFVLSFTQHLVTGLTEDVKKELSPIELSYHKGIKIIRESNCNGCHILDPDRIKVEFYREKPGSVDAHSRWLNGLIGEKIEVTSEQLETFVRNLVVATSISPLLNKAGEITPEMDESVKDEILDTLENLDREKVIEHVLEQISKQKEKGSYYGRKILTEEVANTTADDIDGFIEDIKYTLLDDMEVCFESLYSDDTDDINFAKTQLLDWKGKKIINNTLYTEFTTGEEVLLLPILLEPSRRVSWIVDNKTLEMRKIQETSKLIYDSQVRNIYRQWGGDVITHLSKYKLSNKEIVENEVMQIVPPYLVTQGKKTHPEWLFNFLKEPFPLRFSLLTKYDEKGIPQNTNIRMPTFGFTDREAELLVDYFHANDARLTDPPYAKKKISEENQHEFINRNLAQVLYLYEVLESNCKSCHKVNGEGANIAPDLNLAKERLKEDWMYHFFRNPTDIYPNTPMPIPNTLAPIDDSWSDARSIAAKVIALIPVITTLETDLKQLDRELELIQKVSGNEELLGYHLGQIKMIISRYRYLITNGDADSELKKIFNRESPPQKFENRVEPLSRLVPLYNLLKKINRKRIESALTNDGNIKEHPSTKEILRMLSLN